MFSLCMIYLLLWLSPVSLAEKCLQSVEMSLTPTFSHIQSIECGLSISGGSMDLSSLTFSTVDDQSSPMAQPSIAEVLFFRLPDDCADRSPDGSCDWTTLGVGASVDRGTNNEAGESSSTATSFWCCTEEAIDLGLCDEIYEGHFLLNSSLFQGHHRTIEIPATGNIQTRIRHGTLKDLERGNYIVLTSNCNVHGRAIQVTGALDWPQHSYLANSTASPLDLLPDDDTLTNFDNDDDDVFRVKELPSFGRHFLNYLVVGVATSAIAISIICWWRNREMARWQVYRTHQLLQAQDEAFDLDLTEDFDLELVEAKPGMRMTG